MINWIVERNKRLMSCGMIMTMNNTMILIERNTNEINTGCSAL